MTVMKHLNIKNLLQQFPKLAREMEAEPVKYREMTISVRGDIFDVDCINCFSCYTLQSAKDAIDRYLDGDKDPQCLKPRKPCPVCNGQGRIQIAIENGIVHYALCPDCHPVDYDGLPIP